MITKVPIAVHCIGLWLGTSLFVLHITGPRGTCNRVRIDRRPTSYLNANRILPMDDVFRWSWEFAPELMVIARQPAHKSVKR